MTSHSACLEASLPSIEQGTEVWKTWRKSKVGSSDIPIIMGDSDFDTPLGLFRKKKGLEAEKDTNWAMTRGTENEPKVRALYELQTGFDVPPAILIHPDLPWAIASLDGDNEQESLIAEFKYAGAETHEEARQGRIPKKYFGQVQWQLFVSGRKRAHYVSLAPDGMTVEIVGVTLDPEYASRMIEKATDFYAHLETNVAPPMTERDFLNLDDEKSRDVFTRWREAKLRAMQIEEILEKAKAQSKDQAEKLETARTEIQALITHPKVKCAGVKVITVQRKAGPTLDIRLIDTD